MLPILLEYGVPSFTCCNQTPKCRENKMARDGSKVTSSDCFLCHMKFNYIHCFYYSKYTGSPSTQQEILLCSFQYSFYAERKEVCWGEKSCTSLPSPHAELCGRGSHGDLPSPIISLCFSSSTARFT